MRSAVSREEISHCSNKRPIAKIIVITEGNCDGQSVGMRSYIARTNVMSRVGSLKRVSRSMEQLADVCMYVCEFV